MRSFKAIPTLGLAMLMVLAGCACAGKGRTPGTPAVNPSTAPADSPQVSDPAGAGTAAPQTQGAWRILPAAPLPAGHGYASAWTGTELTIHGSIDAAYNPRTNK